MMRKTNVHQFDQEAVLIFRIIKNIITQSKDREERHDEDEITPHIASLLFVGTKSEEQQKKKKKKEEEEEEKDEVFFLLYYRVEKTRRKVEMVSFVKRKNEGEMPQRMDSAHIFLFTASKSKSKSEKRRRKELLLLVSLTR